MKQSFFLFLALALLFSACNNQDQDEDVIDVGESRVVKMMQNESSRTSQTDYIYDGENLTQSIHKTQGQTGDWKNQYKTDFTKNGDEIIEHRYSFVDSTWVDTTKEVRTLSGDNITEFRSYTYVNGQWNLRMRWTYEYENNQLVSAVAYSIDNDVFTPTDDYQVNYSDGKISNCFMRSYNGSEWISTMKIDYIYDGSQLSHNIFYSVNGEDLTPLDKWEYYYEDDKLVMDKTYIYYDETWNEVAQINYTYDARGNLIEVVSDQGYGTVYEYESGIGNAEFFLQSWFPDLFGFPNITKEQVKKNEPYQRLFNSIGQR